MLTLNSELDSRHFRINRIKKSGSVGGVPRNIFVTGGQHKNRCFSLHIHRTIARGEMTLL